ncbi:MAG: hybrid sensor histidine kinase/response regulator [Proteobacteria bacterium]|nr:hybrid sensor histidine kinase/response regulator [Pseudomonadota bacterium]MBU1688553.1 hybrid sensor histidine kinase/response regulator [Pseudomonadota bacterium]
MKILIIDDSRSVRGALRSTLEKKGYEVIEARDGQEGVALCRDSMPDLITMDVQMPNMDGFEAAAEIRKLEGGTVPPIIFVTGKDSMEDRERGFSLGAADFISKNTPTPWLEVGHVVDRILRFDHQFTGRSVLVFTPDQLTAMTVNTILNQKDMKVISVALAADVLPTAANINQEIDLVLLDLRGGISVVTGLIKSLRQKAGLGLIPFIILCQPEDRPNLLEFFRIGASDYITIPFAKEELLARVRGHLDRIAMVRELGMNVQELERLSKLRDEFLAVTSHDLKSPLTAILGCCQLLQLEQTITGTNRECLTNIFSSSQFMLQLINDIVEVGRNAAGNSEVEPIPLHLTPLLQFAISSQMLSAQQKGINLDTGKVTGEPMIAGDRNHLLRIFNNLLSNAVKFTLPGGTVTIAVQDHDGEVDIIIRDTGIGIPAAMLPSLFDQFSKTSRRGTAGEPGTGLGLSIVKQLVERHNGTIAVESEVEKGTTFRVCFPLYRST